MSSTKDLTMNSKEPQSSVETDLLIIGAGPAGASLACFLARYGLKGIMISSAPGTAETPRAHITNMAALECLRDIGLWEQCEKLGHGGQYMMHYRWCESMSGEEYARNWSWGNGDRRGDYKVVSPCKVIDLPQTELEPILVREATGRGFNVRFDTELLEFEVKEEGKIRCVVQDRVSKVQYTITTKYLFGADGGRSLVAQRLGLPFTVLPGGGLAFNILVKADLADLMQHRQGNLHWNMRLKKDYPFMCVGRMVKPWHEWLFVVLPKGPDAPNPERTFEEWKALVEDVIDDETVDVEVLGVSKWMINETSADVISKGNVFCLGDAIHRHPPTNGLGSNTCIQDSFNLAWKINLVLEGLASPSLLDTFNTERQPIGAHLVKTSNETLRKHILVWQALGVMPPGTSESERLAGINLLKENSEEGKKARKVLKERVADMQHETHALGLEMGHLYQSRAIYTVDESGPFVPGPREKEDPILYYEPCTYPGRRLPHVWLNTPIPGKLISTLDVAGKGKFCLFTGIGGENWKVAARNVSDRLGVEIKAVSIGTGQNWEDCYLSWEEKRGVEEDGCVLVRPDLFVAWRSERCGRDEKDCTGKLERVMWKVLHLECGNFF
ncbi:hypothetical protein K469DRAFT_665653 [Zopfia rhizophila CBS 207.26]|uniref:FAD-binding domain-containing protein n=1 Tax=Zopfia rhizophila CBS 207.26 TaxID=1314779 RepID=A0A6A6E0N7_9PEZI|nr:hypothetical protein K469DRAFT_665653 [Zopfia rhizophila CBS 207.26]